MSSTPHSEAKTRTLEPPEELIALRPDPSMSPEEFKAIWKENREIYEEFRRTHPEARYWYLKALRDSEKHGRI